MHWLLDTLLITGSLTFAIHIFSSNSATNGTSTWKLKHIAGLIAGFCIFILFGLIGYWHFSQGAENIVTEGLTSKLVQRLLYGEGNADFAPIFFSLFGVLLFWGNVNELFQLATTKWTNHWVIAIAEILAVPWLVYDLWIFYRENGRLFTYDNVSNIIFTILFVSDAVTKIKSSSSDEIKTLVSEQLE